MYSNPPILLVGKNNFVELDCDCACSTPPFPFDVQPLTNGKFKLVPDLFFEKLNDGFWVTLSPFSPGGPCVLNLGALDRLHSFATPSPCLEDIDFELAMQNLIVPEGKPFKVTSSDSDQLVVWLHITNACNLDCPYCYVRKSSERMTEEIGKNAIDTVVSTAEKNGFQKIKIKYAGGEATLHFDLIIKLHEYLVEKVSQKDLQIDEIILSNGVYFAPRLLNWMEEEKIKLMISIDGIGEAHDKQRPMKKGGNTFQIIEKNIINTLIPRGIIPFISVTITKINALSIVNLIEWILKNQLPFNLNFYRENSQSLSRKDLMLEEEMIIEGLLRVYSYIEKNLPEDSLINSLLDKVTSKAHTHTCGVGQNYLVINHFGHLSQCQMHLDQPVSNNISNSSMLLEVKQGPIQNLPVDQKSECRKCSFRYRCTGGCPLETYRATGRWDVKSPHCHIYKTLYPRVLRLEGLRLVKIHGLA